MSLAFVERDALRVLHQTLDDAQSDVRALRRMLAERKYRDDQTRAPAGTPQGGQWVPEGGFKKPERKPAKDKLGFALFLATQAGVAFYNRLDALRRGVIIEFAAEEFTHIGEKSPQIVRTALLNDDEIREVCPRLDDVQARTDRAADEVGKTIDKARFPQDYGTAVHLHIAKGIDALNDSTYRAEISFYKSHLAAKEESSYGKKDTVRIDVLELRPDKAVCVYDIKTGKADLAWPRIVEIGRAVYQSFGKAHRIFVIRVSPRK